jgi:hypothetical protein
LVKDGWSSAAKPGKRLVNGKIVQLAKTIIKGKEKFATGLTLDGSNMFTCRTWINELGLLAKNIDVPNPFNSKHEHYKKIYPETENVNVEKKFLYDHLASLSVTDKDDEKGKGKGKYGEEGKKYTIFFADFCGTLEGTEDKKKETKPILDLELAFSRKVFCSEMFPESLLITTFSTRSPGTGNLKEERFGQIILLITDLSSQNGYFPLVAWTKTYCDSNTMMVCAFYIRKLEDVVSGKIKFLAHSLENRKTTTKEDDDCQSDSDNGQSDSDEDYQENDKEDASIKKDEKIFNQISGKRKSGKRKCFRHQSTSSRREEEEEEEKEAEEEEEEDKPTSKKSKISTKLITVDDKDNSSRKRKPCSFWMTHQNRTCKLPGQKDDDEFCTTHSKIEEKRRRLFSSLK